MRDLTKRVFDISKHEFSCESFYSAALKGDVVELEGDYCVSYIINKQDSIALAKALGVTGKDLN